MADEKDADRFLIDKAASRIVIARALNGLFDQWKDLPEDWRDRLQDSLVAVLADLTAECATGTREPTKEQFLDFMGKAYDHAVQKRQALEDGAYV